MCEQKSKQLGLNHYYAYSTGSDGSGTLLGCWTYDADDNVFTVTWADRAAGVTTLPGNAMRTTPYYERTYGASRQQSKQQQDDL